MRASPIALSTPTHSPWNQSSHTSHAIIHRWSSGPRHRQYGPWSDSSPSPSSPLPAELDPAPPPRGAGDEVIRCAALLEARAAVLLPPRAPLPAREAEPVLRLVVFFTSVAVPFFLEAREAAVGFAGGELAGKDGGGSEERGSDLLGAVAEAGVGRVPCCARSGISAMLVPPSRPSLVSLLMSRSGAPRASTLGSMSMAEAEGDEAAGGWMVKWESAYGSITTETVGTRA